MSINVFAEAMTFATTEEEIEAALKSKNKIEKNIVDLQKAYDQAVKQI